MRLSEATLAQLASEVEAGEYDRYGQRTGIVHLGIGAFHRAHQAWYTDRALAAGERDWMIAGISLRSSAVAEQMNPQDGLYTVVERSAAGAAARLVGSVRGVLVAASEPDRVTAALAASETRIVSLTITEKGYLRAPDGSLDLGLAGAGGIYRYLADAFGMRMAAGLGGVTLLSCDNLAGNGAILHALVATYLDRHDPRLRSWFEAECTCPSTMVDRIVPATTPQDRTDVAALIGLDDAATVLTEPFHQWVIEDRFAAGRPGWDRVGAQLVDDVAPYETAKLRMLNGAHSLLAYCGLERGHQFIHQAMADPTLRDLVWRLMRDEAAPSMAPAPGQDLERYAHELMARFDNPALNHRLVQIAMDGSQKIPQRWLETLAARQRMVVPSPAILTGLSAWLCHVRGDLRPVDDPLAAPLAAIWRAEGAHGVVEALFGDGGLMASPWRPDGANIVFLQRHLA